MKGLLFTELLGMAQEDFGYNTASFVQLRSGHTSKIVYADNHTYRRTEMIQLFEQLQQHTKLPAEQLAAAFGRRLCRRITQVCPQHKAYVNRIFYVLSRSGATPVFEYLQTDGNSLIVLYNPYAKTICLTDGMIKGYLDYLQELSPVEETIFSNGRRKFVITLN